MAYTTINKSTDYFNTKLWSGNNGTQALTGVGFQPDWLWIKARTGASNNHRLVDAVRGVTKVIYSSSSDAEGTASGVPQSFDSDGFTLNTSDSAINGNGVDYVGWNWKGNGAGSANTDGSINTTSTSVNTTAGFSISKYTGTGADATFGHGLGVTPDIVFWKRLDNSAGGVNWIVQSPILGNQTKLVLNTADATSTGSSFSQTDNWTNSLIDLKTYEGENSSGGTYIAYAFASKSGYSKIGSYTGNGNADGTFVYTGFKPSFVVVKNSAASANWYMFDNKRLDYNVVNRQLFADTDSAEATATSLDILSNGFKIRATDSGFNGSGNSIIYMAFGQTLVGTNNIPATAR